MRRLRVGWRQPDPFLYLLAASKVGFEEDTLTYGFYSSECFPQVEQQKHPIGPRWPKAVEDNNKKELLFDFVFENIKEYLKELISVAVEKEIDEAFLTFYIREWKRYTEVVRFINYVFRDLNRNWIK